MNYIKRLQVEKCILEVTINDIRGYLLSPKFQAEGELQGYVNIKDILNRLDEWELFKIRDLEGWDHANAQR